MGTLTGYQGYGSSNRRNPRSTGGVGDSKQNQVSRNDIRNAPDDNMRRYLVARRAGNWEAAGRLQRQRRQTGQFNREINVFDTAQREQSDQLLGLFRQESELRQARARGAVETNVSGQLAARGIRGPAEAAAVQRTEQALMSQLGQEQADFTSKLAQIQSAQRQGFLQNQFNFFHELDRMALSQEYQKDLINLQADIQSDQNKWNWATDLLSITGAAALTYATGGATAPLLAGAVGNAAGNAAGSQAGGGAGAYDPYTDNWDIS